MRLTASLILIFAILASLSIARAQDRAPHGLMNEPPIAFSPQAYDFFHPCTKNPHGAESSSPLPLAATVQSDMAHESKSTPETRKSGLGAGGIAGIVFGLVFVVISAMGVYYAVITRRANINSTKLSQPVMV